MNDLLLNIRRTVKIVLSVLLSFAALTAGNTFRVRSSDDLRLRIAFFSDTHVTDDTMRMNRYRMGLNDVTKHVRPDVFIVTGDLTDHGEDAHYGTFAELTRQYLDVGDVILSWGDHDSWNEAGFDRSRELYLDAVKELTGQTTDSLYFARVINGYTFIVMNSETTAVEAVISDAQIKWVSDRLAEARSTNDLPIFVINHWPMTGTHVSPDNRHDNCYADSEASRRLQEMLDGYENVFYFCGHLHNGLNLGAIDYPEGFRTIETVGDGITSVDLPPYQFGSYALGGYAPWGSGMIADVYDDRIELIGRNFALSYNIAGFDIELPLAS